MSAGQPNWQKLHEMGKLPKSARSNIPMLTQLDEAEAKIEELEAEIKKLRGDESNEQGSFSSKCETEGCEFIAEGKSQAVANNNLRLHTRSHPVK